MKTFNEAITEQSKTRPLGWLIGGYRVLTNSKRPIKTIDDMAGLKWRVPPVELQLAAFRSWGVEPHPLPWIETFNGLQQGVIDGQENPHLINRDAKFWEVQKYITDIHYMLWVAPILVSERWFAKLDLILGSFLFAQPGKLLSMNGSGLKKRMPSASAMHRRRYGHRHRVR